MSRRRFAIIVAAWAATLALATTGVGALLGVFVGFGIAMFGGALGVLVQTAATLLGFELDWIATGTVLYWGAIGAFACLAAWIAALGLRELLRGGERAALSHFAAGLSVAAFPVACWLSLQALARAWPV